MEYESLSRCLGGEMVDTRDSKSRAKGRGGSSPLQGILLRIQCYQYYYLRLSTIIVIFISKTLCKAI